ncbi:HAD family phosphatase [Paludibacter sp. 221]|uniref:HAD family hydrolase n=1 Tax=Paludibacter sp. 221 TaxID=2302939 RepID=UPI0013D0A073|nr:HAD family phosphatase [Paludibacter sp. 221]NDV47774.1 HAD family phosphatase [Paludibacter sp. 221]
MKQFTNITTLIFDFGGVLINLDKQRCIRNFEKLGFSNVKNYLGDFIQTDFFLQMEEGKMDENEFYSEIKKHGSNDVTNQQIKNAWNSFLLDIPAYKLDMLLELRKKFKVLLLSNTNPIHIEHSEDIFLSHKGLTMDNYFDKRYLSYEMKMSKPHAEIFEAVLDDAKLRPEECLFLDDGAKNIEQAQKMGFNTYLVPIPDSLDFLLKPETWK